MYSVDRTTEEKIALLLEVREGLGWNKAQFAAHIGKTEQTVAMWESGKVSIGPELMHWLLAVQAVFQREENPTKVSDLLLLGGLAGLIRHYLPKD